MQRILDYFRGTAAAAGGNDHAEEDMTIITSENFSSARMYALLSSDATQVLEATDEVSSRFPLSGGMQAAIGMFNRVFPGGNVDAPTPGGTSLRFSPRTPQQLQSPASKFAFSNNNGRYRLHSFKLDARMLFFLGTGVTGKPREWVVWNDNRVADNGSWEVLEIIWDGARIKLKGHEGQYVKWNVTNFVATHEESEATEFILRQV